MFILSVQHIYRIGIGDGEMGDADGTAGGEGIDVSQKGFGGRFVAPGQGGAVPAGFGGPYLDRTH